MNFIIFSGVLLVVSLLWIAWLVNVIHKRLVMRELEISLEENTYSSGLATGVDSQGQRKRLIEANKLLGIERVILNKLKIKPNNVTFFIWLLRIVTFIVVIALLALFRGLALAGIAAIVVGIVFDQMTKDMVYRSGIENIPKVTNFLNSFIPNLRGGATPQQAMARYIDMTDDEELAEYIEDRYKEGYVIPPSIKGITDAFLMAEESESKGMGNYVNTLNEMAEDYNSKTKYYNQFLGALGEIKPISYAYYFGVPVVIYVSYGQTAEVWRGPWSWPMALALVGLFAAFKFLMYKIQSNTINKIF